MSDGRKELNELLPEVDVLIEDLRFVHLVLWALEDISYGDISLRVQGRVKSLINEMTKLRYKIHSEIDMTMNSLFKSGRPLPTFEKASAYIDRLIILDIKREKTKSAKVNAEYESLLDKFQELLSKIKKGEVRFATVGEVKEYAGRSG